MGFALGFLLASKHLPHRMRLAFTSELPSFIKEQLVVGPALVGDELVCWLYQFVNDGE